MANSLGISRNSYRSIEKGSTNVISRRLGEIAHLLGVSEEELALGYQPVESAEKLEDIRLQYRKSVEEVTMSADARIAELEKTVSIQNETIANLREIIDSKNEIISLLKRRAKSSGK